MAFTLLWQKVAANGHGPVDNELSGGISVQKSPSSSSGSTCGTTPNSDVFLCADEENDPFQVLLLRPPADKPRVNRLYVARNVAYVLDMEIKEAEKLAKQAMKQGAVVLGTWTMRECVEFEEKLMMLDIMCRSIPAPVGNGVIAGDPAFLWSDDDVEEKEEEDFFVQKPQRVRLESHSRSSSAEEDFFVQKPQKVRLESHYSHHMSPLKNSANRNKIQKPQRSQQRRTTKQSNKNNAVEPHEVQRLQKRHTRQMSTDEAEMAISMNPITQTQHQHPRKQLSSRKKSSTKPAMTSRKKQTWAEI